MKIFGKSKKSLCFDTDGISNHFLKTALCDIYNLSTATAVFPDYWEISRVAPILKQACLPFLSRVFEKSVFSQLCEYLDKNKLIYYK